MPIAPFPLLAPVRVANQAAQTVPDLTEEERQGLIAALSGKVVGALQYAAETLDKPGAAVRGLLAGQPEQLLNLIPFSDTFGLTDPTKRVYGRDLLEKAGIAAPNQQGLFNSVGDAAGDIGGFALDVALDPLVLFNLTGKSLTKAGLEASKAGGAAVKAIEAGVAAGKPLEMGKVVQHVAEAGSKHLGTTAAATGKEIRAGQRTLASLRLPFTEAPFYNTNFGLSPNAAAKVIENLAYSPFSPVPWVRNLFSKTVGGISPKSYKAITATAKELEKAHTEGLAWAKPGSLSFAQHQRDLAVSEGIDLMASVQDVSGLLKKESGGVEALYKDLAQHHATDAPAFKTFQDFAVAMAETKNGAAAGGRAAEADIASMFAAGVPGVEDFSRRFHGFVDGVIEMNRLGYDKYLELGGVGEHLDDIYASYFPRRPSVKGAFNAGDDAYHLNRAKRLLNPKTPYASARNDVLRHLPGGTRTVNVLSREGRITGTAGASSKLQNALIEDLERELKQAIPDYGAAIPGGQPWQMSREEFKNQAVFSGTGRSKREFGQAADTLYFTNQPGLAADYAVGGELRYAILADLPEGTWLDDFGEAITPQEYWDYHVDNAIKGVKWRGTIPIKEASDPHRYVVKRAIAEGKPVPAEVIAEYPDLAVYLKQGTGTKGVANVQSDYVAHILQQEALRAGKNLGDNVDEFMRLRGVASPALTEYLRKLPDSVVKTGLFDQSLVKNFFDYQHHLAISLSNLYSAHGFLRGVAKLGDSEVTEGMVPITEAWNIGSKDGKPLLDQRGLVKLARDYAADLQKTNPAEVARLQIDPNDIEGLIGRMRVPQKAADVLRQYTEISKPGPSTWVGDVYDKMLGAFRWGVTSPFPGFHARNFTDGLWRNAAAGGADAYSLSGLAKAYKQTRRFLSGKEELKYLDEIVDLDVASSGVSRYLSSEVSEEAATFGGFTNIFKTMAGKGIRKSENPSRVKRIFENVKAGTEEAYNYIEFMNRVPPYIALREKGLTPSQAKAFVDRVQFDYLNVGKNAAVEKTMRRIFPFWGFVRNNVPYQISQLVNSPGGRHAQTLRLMNAMRQSTGEDAPDWLKERMSIRVGGPDEEAQVLRQFGLSIEDLSDVSFKDNKPNWKRLGERLLAKSTPAISLPYKLLSGRDPYTGRERKNLAPVTGNSVFDTLLYSSPASRGISTGQMLSDTRKTPGLRALDFFTGMKVGTYDLPQQLLYELKRRQYDDLADYPEIREFKEAYIPADKKPTASAAAVKKLDDVKRVEALIRALREERSD